jgi:hypothetical protein
MTEKEILSEVKCGNYCGIYESENGRTQYEWGKYDYSVPQSQQSPDYAELCKAVIALNKKSNTHFAVAEQGDKFNNITTYTYKALSENKHAYEQAIRSSKELVKKLKAAGFSNKEVDDQIKAEIKAKNKLIKDAKEISVKVGFEVSPEQYTSIKELVKPKCPMNYDLSIKLSKNWNYKTFASIEELFAFLNSADFRRDLIRDGDRISKATIYLKNNYFNIELYKGDGYSQYINVHYRQRIEGEKLDHNKALTELIDKFTKIYLSLKEGA